MPLSNRCLFFNIMEFIEKDLETIIWENAQTKEGREKLSKRGLYIRGKLLRQVNIGGYGIVDLLSIEVIRGLDRDEFVVTIYELKKDLINIDCLIQSFRYYTGIQRFIETNYSDYLKSFDLTIDVVLVGKTVDTKSDFVFLLNRCIEDSNLYIYTYKYDIDGLSFNYIDNGWYKTIERFDSVNLDFTKFSIDDKKQMLGALND